MVLLTDVCQVYTCHSRIFLWIMDCTERCWKRNHISNRFDRLWKVPRPWAKKLQSGTEANIVETYP